MDLRTIAMTLIGLFAVGSIVLFVYRYFPRTKERTIPFTLLTSSCFRAKELLGTDYKFKTGVLLSTATMLTEGDIKKITGFSTIGASTTNTPAKFKVTKKTVGTITNYYLNIVFEVKNVSSGDSAGSTTPGSDLVFSITIDYSNGDPSDQIPDIKPIPIEIWPC